MKILISPKLEDFPGVGMARNQRCFMENSNGRSVSIHNPEEKLIILTTVIAGHGVEQEVIFCPFCGESYKKDKLEIEIMKG